MLSLPAPFASPLFGCPTTSTPQTAFPGLAPDRVSLDAYGDARIRRPLDAIKIISSSPAGPSAKPRAQNGTGNIPASLQHAPAGLINCQWRDAESPCAAVLAGADLLHQHVTAIHLSHTDSAANARLESDEDDFWHASCLWADCQIRHIPLWSITALADHVREAHLNSSDYRLDASASWPQTKARARRLFRRATLPGTLPLLPIGSIRLYPSSLSLVRPYQPSKPRVLSSEVMLRKRSRTSGASDVRGPPKLIDQRYPLLPARADPDRNVPFYPIDGEIEISHALKIDAQRSGSIFPLPWWTDSDVPEEDLKLRALLASSHKRQRVGLKVIERPEKARCPPLGVGCQTMLDWKAEKQKRRREEEGVDIDCEGQMDTGGGGRPADHHVKQAIGVKEERMEVEEAETRFRSDQVFTASKRYAAKRARRSFGIRYWEERMAFEKRGVELGELDC